MGRSLFERAIYRVQMLCPNNYFFNNLIARGPFKARNKRYPLDPDDPKATINDYIYDRIVSNRWTDLQLRCVDKETCKEAFREMAPSAKTPRTIEVIDGHESSFTFEIFTDKITKHFNTKTVAKPTAGSGSVLFLRTVPPQDRLLSFYKDLRHNFFFAHRESQYATLRKKCIVEDDISTGQELTDYKFFCSYGRVFACQVDEGRYTKHTKTYLSLPDFTIIDATWGAVGRSDHVERPENLDEMMELSKQLSLPFEFVRVDLYNTSNGVFVGELTFTHGCSREVLSDEAFGRQMLANVKDGSKFTTFWRGSH